MPTTTRRIWGFWDCTSCDKTRITGKLKACPTCGSPRERDELDDAYLGHARDAQTGRVLTDDVATEPYRGPDWTCVNCEAGNPGDELRCLKCGASRVVLDVKEKTIRPRRAGDREERCSTCGDTYPHSSNESYRACLDMHTSDAPPHVDAGPSWQEIKARTRKRRTALVISGGAVVLALVVWVLVWAFTPYNAEGVVTDTSWTHYTHRDTWTDVRDAGWCDGLFERAEREPVDGKGERAGIDVTSRRMKHHHYIEVACGMKQVACTHRVKTGESCYTTPVSCSTSSNGDGSFTERCTGGDRKCDPTYGNEHSSDTVTKYCDESVEEPWCDYDTQKWRETQTEKLAGVGEAGGWPEITPGRLDRIRKTSAYRVAIAYTDRKDRPDEYVERPKVLGDYATWTEGEIVRLEVFNMGVVKAVYRGDTR